MLAGQRLEGAPVNYSEVCPTAWIRNSPWQIKEPPPLFFLRVLKPAFQKAQALVVLDGLFFVSPGARLAKHVYLC